MILFLRPFVNILVVLGLLTKAAGSNGPYIINKNQRTFKVRCFFIFTQNKIILNI